MEDAHLKIREVARTYESVACGKVLRTRSNLHQHMRNHNRTGRERMNTGTDKLGPDGGLHGRTSHPVLSGWAYLDRQLVWVWVNSL